MCRSMRRGLGLLPGYAEGNLTTSLRLRLSGLEYRHIRLLPQVDDDICYVRRCAANPVVLCLPACMCRQRR